MKKLKISLFVTFFSFTFFLSSCKSDDIDTTSSEYNDLLTSMSIFDLRHRAINRTSYVKEVVIVSFSSNKLQKESIVFNGKPYTDDGKNNDLLAGDGVFTSLGKFDFDSKVNYDEKQLIKSFVNAPIIDPLFEKSHELHDYIAKYEYFDNSESSNARKPAIVEVSCPVKFGTSGCYAHEWGLCNYCCVTIDTDNCTMTIGF